MASKTGFCLAEMSLIVCKRCYLVRDWVISLRANIGHLLWVEMVKPEHGISSLAMATKMTFILNMGIVGQVN